MGISGGIWWHRMMGTSDDVGGDMDGGVDDDVWS